MKTLAYLSLALFLVSCGGDYKDPALSGPGADTTFNGQSVKVVGGSLQVDNGTLSGSGAVLFGSAYPQIKEGGSYALDFSLEEGGSVTLVSHSDSALNAGFEIEFRRQGTGAGSLKVRLSAQGTSKEAVDSTGLEVFSGFDASRPLKFQLDVHNNEAPAHILVWSRLVSDSFSEDEAVLNSEENDNSPGMGSGTRWGLKIQNASVARAEKSAPKFEE